MIVSIHQPNYLPWLGYLQKVLAADVFVFLDHVQFTKGYTQRVQILDQGEVRWLTVPVRSTGQGLQPITETRFEETKAWRSIHLRTLRSAYGRHPFFREVYPVVEASLSVKHETLAEQNVAMLLALAQGLGARCRFVRSGELPLEGLARNAMLARIVRTLGGAEYLHGKGGGEYHEPEVFAAEGVALRPQQFTHPVYPQPGREDFVAGLTSLDALFNLGWEGTRALLVAEPAPAEGA